MLEEIDHCEIGGIYMHAVEDLENTLKDIFITTESTYNQQVELENLLEEVDPRSLIRIIWENSETIYSFRTEKNREQCMEYCESELFKKWVTLLYVTHSGEGEGLLFYGATILPFVDHFPKNTELYRIMTTKPQELKKEDE